VAGKLGAKARGTPAAQGVSELKAKPTKAEIRATNRAVGRPPKYATPDQMEKAVDAYFEKMLMSERPPTMAGLTLELGFLSVDALLDQECRKEYGPEFSSILKKATLKIKMAHEERLFGGNPTGSIFWLKTQAGWKETQVTEHSGNVTIVDDIGRG
jgi:hypothetical protein